MKKLVTFFLALAMPIMLWAYDFRSGELFYNITSNSEPYTVEVACALSSITTATIPGNVTYNGIQYSVTSIGYPAFYMCESLTSVTIPNSVTSIGNSVFYGCSSLTSITIPNSVTSIGDDAFYDCDGLTSITIPNSVTSIGNYAFLNCDGLTSITIPNNITSIGQEVFSSCSSLTSVVWNAKSCADFSSYYDAPFYYIKSQITSFFFGDDVEYIPADLCSGMSKLLSITIPNSVTSIGNYAFYGCSGLTSLTIPNRVTSIGQSAFYGCSGLTSVTLGNSVTSIGKDAFFDCDGLTSITIPNSVTSIGESAFSNCNSLTSLVWNAKSCDDFQNPFDTYDCKITSLTIGESVQDIPEYLCSYMGKLTSVVWNVKSYDDFLEYGDSPFSDYNPITSFTFGESVQHIPAYLCSGLDNLTSVTIGSNVTSIGNNAFYGCDALTSITIPNSVTSIGNQAFADCFSLTSITIPNSVTSIGESAFSDCDGLTSVTIGNRVTSIGEHAFSDCDGLTSIAIPNSVTSIGNSFSGCSGLISITLPNSVISIGDDAFYNCSSLSSITIPNSVTRIGNYAFYGCSGLTSITIPNSVTSIGGRAFSNCDSLTSVVWNVKNYSDLSFSSASPFDDITYQITSFTFGDDVEYIPAYLCYGMNLSSITIPDGVTSIGNDAFAYCSGLTSVTIGNSITSIGNYAFSMCSSLNSVTIGNSVTSIGDFAFGHCSSLTSITIPDGVTSIGNQAFAYCSGLTSVTIGNSITTIGNSLFLECDSLTSVVWNVKKCSDFSFHSDVPPFFGFQITSFIFGDDVEYIPANLCYGMSNLSSITIPNSVTSIGDAAFLGSSSFDTIYVEATTPPTLVNQVFPTPSVCHVPCGTLAAYKSSDWASQVWSFVEDCVEGMQITYTSTDGNIVTPYKTDAFGATIVSNTYENGVGTITFDGPITSIGDYAFYECSALTSITIPSSVKSIGDLAFVNCSSLPFVTIPNSVTSIGQSAFHGCSSLTYITIPNSVTSIGEGAFGGCSSLTSMVVESGNANYDSRENCNAIIETTTNTLIAGCQNTIIPNSVTSIATHAFSGRSSLISITIPKSVVSIGSSAFWGCSSLTSITIPNSVESIGNYAFCKCSSLDTIYAEATTPPTLGEDVFYKTPSPICFIPCGTKAAYEASDWVNYVGEFVETYEYTLTLSSSDNSMGSATITQEPACGTPAIIVATPNVGYHFVQWSDGNTDNPRTLTVSQDMELTAEFEKDVDPTWQIKYTSTDGNIVTPTKTNDFGANIVSNTYENGVGTITFDGPVTSIGEDAFFRSSLLTSIIIPDRVINIRYHAFYECSSLTSVIISNSVKSIGNGAFFGCSSLLSITIPDSVTSIGESAFDACLGLEVIVVENENTTYDSRNSCNAIIETATNVLVTGCKKTIIPNTVMSIGESAFRNCNLMTSITIPNSVTSIGEEAFAYCYNLNSVTIGNSVTNIGRHAFRYCSMMFITIPNSVTSIGEGAFSYCQQLTSVTIGNNVTNLDASAFSNCSQLSSIISLAPIPSEVMDTSVFTNVVKTIPIYVPCGSVEAYKSADGWNAFTNIQEPLPQFIISVSSQSNEMGEAKVDRNTYCEGAQISATAYDGYHFVQWSDGNTDNPRTLTVSQDMELTAEFEKDVDPTWQIKYTSTDGNIVTPNKTDVFGANIVSNTYENGVGTITFDGPVTSIGFHAFSGCSSLTSITIPNGVRRIGDFVFKDCSSLASMVVESGNTTYDSRDNCNAIIETATNTLIAGCQNTIVPNSVTSIGDGAFRGHSSLTSITIPNSVTSIGNGAFYYCSSLDTIYVEATTPPTLVGGVFKATPSPTCIIPCGTLDAYQASDWAGQVGAFEDPCYIDPTWQIKYTSTDGNIVTPYSTDVFGANIVSNTYENGQGVITFDAPVTSLGDLAFHQCSSLVSVTIPNSVINIGNNAFRSCSSLASITIPNSVTSIGQETFYGCSSLTSVTIGNSVKNIGGAAFFNCTKLTSITIPQCVTTIGVSAFHCCSSLASIIVEEGNTTYDSRNNCNAIIETTTNTLIVGCQNTIIPNSVTSIVPSAFSWCTSLISIAIPDGVTSIGNNTFYSCFSLASVSIPSSVTSIGNDAFNHCSSLSSITIPNSVTNIGNDAFRSCSSITTVTIPNNVTSIGEGTFADCSSLISVTIGNSVTSIGRLAFYRCSSIDTIHVEATTPPTVDVEAFLSTSISTCYIPCGTLAAYQASDWANYVGEFVETYEYTLTLSSSDNSMGSATIIQEPACGTPAIIIATPNAGYLFSQWSDGNTDNPRTLSVTEDMKLTAQWTPNTNIPYIVSHYRQALDGTYPSTLKETENLMGTTAANVTPVVKTYTGFTSPVAKTATIAADGSTVVEYYYTRNKYILTWSTDGDALTGAFSKGSVLFEAAITRPNTPTKTGYTFAGWDNTVPATMPAENLTLTALFTIHTYSVILTADQNGTVSGGGTYNYGESVTITATPNDGYTFSQWSDGNTDNPRTLTVTEDIELAAEFEEEGNYGSYTRTVRIGYNTICLPHGSSHFTGATFYEIAHILKNDKKIFFDEAKTLEAGKPYIFYPHSTEVTIYYDNTTSAIPLSHNGLHGTFDGITAASNFLKGKYLVAGNKMVLCGDGCSLAANRAYIVLDEISDKDHPAIPGIKRVSMDYSEESATTALDNITDESIVAPMQEGVYDILGRKVDAPTVSGFYIINGKKVFVMEK